LSSPKEFASAIFEAGAGHVGNYSECSFNAEGTGTFKAEEGTKPFVGEIGKRHEEREIKMEFIFPAYLQRQIVSAMIKAHPYEEVAFDIVVLANEDLQIGSGLVGELSTPITEEQFLQQVKKNFWFICYKTHKVAGQADKKSCIVRRCGELF
jgi:hypothetical protein